MLENKIASKIAELSQHSVEFTEQRFIELTPAGKYQTSLLTAGIVFQILRRGNIFNKDKGANISSILNLLVVHYIRIFEKYKNEYINSNYELKKYNNEFIDSLLKKGNNILELLNPDQIRNSITIGLDQIFGELMEFSKGMQNYKNGISKAVSPQLLFINTFVCPFYLLAVSNENRRETDRKIKLEFLKIRTLSITDSSTFIIELTEHLVSMINKDEAFLTSIKNVEKSVSNNNNNNNNNNQQKNCYIATLAYQDIDHPKVEYLRIYRDARLSKSSIGRKFIKLYYKYSPSIVNWLNPYRIINRVIRKLLDLMIYIIKKTE
jgi:hypothetical protein